MASTLKVDNLLDSQGNAFDGSQLDMSSVNMGKVLQVKHYQLTTSAVINSGTTHTAVLQQAITPTSADSKILIQMTLSGSMANGGTFHGRFYRDSTPIGIGTDSNSIPKETFDGLDNNGSPTDGSLTASMTWIDEPNTTSEVNYWVGCHGATGIFYINRTIAYSSTTHDHNTVSTLTLMEIGA